MRREVSRFICQAKSGWRTATLLGLLLCLSPGARALETSSNVGIDLRYTDNATFASTNTTDELITTGTINASIREDQGPLTGSASASLSYIDYLDNTFDTQTYPRLAGSATWVQYRNVLSWNFNDFYTQTRVNSLGRDTPTNTEDINVANLGGNLTLRPADRHTVVLTPSFSDYYYQTSDSDNQQTGMTARWSYRIKPTIGMSLSGSYRQVDYDNDLTNADYTNTKLDIGVSVQSARGNYAASIGTTKASRDSGGDSNGLSARLAASYKFTGHSSINASVSTDLTDSSTIYLTSSLDPNTGDFGTVQTSDDVVRNSVARFAYSRRGTTNTVSAWIELRDLDYQTTLDDRKVHEIGANFSRRLSPTVSATITGLYTETDIQNVAYTDKHYQTDAQFGYSLSRKLSASAGARYQKRDTGDPISEYDELSVFAKLGYRLNP